MYNIHDVFYALCLKKVLSKQVSKLSKKGKKPHPVFCLRLISSPKIPQKIEIQYNKGCLLCIFSHKTTLRFISSNFRNALKTDSHSDTIFL